MSDYLPEEVIGEILYKLPVKSLLKFTSVCKSWYALIKSPNFITTHLHKTLRSENSHHDDYSLLLFGFCLFKERERLHFLFIDDGEKLKKYQQLHFRFVAYWRYTLVGSCNGLICIRCKNEFIIWNPSIQKFITVPPLDDNRYGMFTARRIGFGFDPKTNDYKIVRILQPIQYDLEELAPIKTELYSLNSNSWKSINGNSPRCRIHNNVPVHVNGALHWIGQQGWESGCSNVVVVFDLENEVFCEIVLPEPLVNLKLNLMAFGDSSIAVNIINVVSVPSFMCDIWVMKKYGVPSSWERLWSVEIKAEDDPFVWGFRKNGELLLECDKFMVSVNLESQQLQRLRKFGRLDGFLEYVDTHVESLVLLDKESNIANAANVSDASDSSDVNMADNTSDDASDDTDASIADDASDESIVDNTSYESDVNIADDENILDNVNDECDDDASDGGYMMHVNINNPRDKYKNVLDLRAEASISTFNNSGQINVHN